jgi:hypothetical protein
MKGFWKWAVLFAAVFIIAWLVAMPLFGGFRYRMMPMMGGGTNGFHMFGGFGFPGGWLMMFGMLLIPLAFIGVLVLGGAAAVAGLTRLQSPTQVAVRTCKHCGKVNQMDWANCPYCGEKV